jgi:hypothetical protein
MSGITNTRHNVPSPFCKVLATAFYDGPTEGFLVHKNEGRLFLFRLLDWDDGQDVRVFAIHVVPNVALDDALNVLAKENGPNWPMWVLPAQLDDAASQFLERARRHARPVAVVAARNLLRVFDVWQDVDENFTFQQQDWLNTFGLSRSTAG